MKSFQGKVVTSIVHYHIKSVQSWELPFKRIDSVNYFVWSKKPLLRRNQVILFCTNPITFAFRSRLPKTKITRKSCQQLPSSSFKLKYSSPMSLTKRNHPTQKERLSDKLKLAKFADCVVIVDNEHTDELTVEMEKTEERCISELEEVFKDVDHHSCGESIKGVWEDNKCD